MRNTSIEVSPAIGTVNFSALLEFLLCNHAGFKIEILCSYIVLACDAWLRFIIALSI